MELLPIVRGFHVGATLLLAGASAFELLILRRADRSCDRFVAQRVRRWLRLLRLTGWAAGVLSWFAWLALVAISMSGLPAAEALTGPVLRTVAVRTTFGHVWWTRLALFVVLAAQLALARRDAAKPSSIDVTVNALGSVGLVCSLAWTGHALGTHPAHLIADAIHLLAAAVWLGMIPPLWLMVRRAKADAGWYRIAVAAADHFFWPGVVAVLALAASGVANATWLLDLPSDLATTRYGRLLAVKVALFVLMVVAATINRTLTRRLRGLPTAQQQHPGMAALRTSMTAELLLGAGVIALVAVLGVTPPAAHEASMHHMSGM